MALRLGPASHRSNVVALRRWLLVALVVLSAVTALTGGQPAGQESPLVPEEPSELSNDIDVLIAIRAELNDPPALSSWLNGSNLCEMQYIKCCAEIGDQPTAELDAVCELLIADLNLPPMPLPPSLTLLRRTLKRLDLSNNSFSGVIPTSWNIFARLEVLNLEFNSLDGVLSESPVSRLTRLTHLQLGSNEFSTGTVPAEFSMLTGLTTLDLNSVPALVGTLPPSYSVLQNLQQLSLAFLPHISGTVPPSWAVGMTSLKTLVLNDDTGLCGSMPSGDSPAWRPADLSSEDEGPGYYVRGTGIGMVCPPSPPSSPMPPPTPPPPPMPPPECPGPLLGHSPGDSGACDDAFYRGNYYRGVTIMCPEGAVVTQMTLQCSDGTVLPSFPANVTRAGTSVVSASPVISTNGFTSISGRINCAAETVNWLVEAPAAPLFQCENSSERIAGVTVSFGNVITDMRFCCRSPDNRPRPPAPPPGPPKPPSRPGSMPPVSAASPPPGPSDATGAAEEDTGRVGGLVAVYVVVPVGVLGCLVLLVTVVLLRHRWRQQLALAAANNAKLNGGGSTGSTGSMPESVAAPLPTIYGARAVPEWLMLHGGQASEAPDVEMAASKPEESGDNLSSVSAPPAVGRVLSGGRRITRVAAHAVLLASPLPPAPNAAPTSSPASAVLPPTLPRGSGSTPLCMDQLFEAQLRQAYSQVKADYQADGSPLGAVYEDLPPGEECGISGSAAAAALQLGLLPLIPAATGTPARAARPGQQATGGVSSSSTAASMPLLPCSKSFSAGQGGRVLTSMSWRTLGGTSAWAYDFASQPHRSATPAATSQSMPLRLKELLANVPSTRLWTDAALRSEPGSSQGAATALTGATSSATAVAAPLARLGHHIQDLPSRPSVRLDLSLQRDVTLLPDQMLGSGAMGVVWRGVFQGRDVAVKVIRPPAGSEDEFLLDMDNFRSEIMILSRLEHPNVVALHGACLQPPQMFLVEELMAGSLMRHIHTRPARRLPLARALQVAADVLTGLEYLHGLHILHRDLKPANVLLAPDGRAKISDFGLARGKHKTYLSTKRVDAGTVAYMAPECFNPDLGRITAATDMFAVGVILWELIAQQRPWQDVPQAAIIFRVVLHGVRLPLPDEDRVRCPVRLAALVRRCWAAAPGERPTAAEARDEVLAIAAEVAAAAATVEPGGAEVGELTMEGGTLGGSAGGGGLTTGTTSDSHSCDNSTF